MEQSLKFLNWEFFGQLDRHGQFMNPLESGFLWRCLPHKTIFFRKGRSQKTFSKGKQLYKTSPSKKTVDPWSQNNCTL